MATETLRTIIIAVLAFSLVMSLGFLFFAEIKAEYGLAAELNSSFPKTTKSIDDIGAISKSMSEEIQAGKEGFSLLEYFGLIFKGAGSIIKMTYTVFFGLIPDISTEISVELGIPPVFITVMSAIIVITVIFIIISTTTRRDL